jgi:hypothetical protein
MEHLSNTLFSSKRGDDVAPASWGSDILQVALLEDPLAFETWWLEQLKIRTPECIADELERIGTSLAHVRAGQVLGYGATVIERGTRFSRVGMLSGDPTVRLFAMLRLAHFEMRVGYAASQGDLFGPPTVIPAIEAILENAERISEQCLLLIEVKMRAHALLAEALLFEGKHEVAKRHISQALLLANALGMSAAKHKMELVQYQIYFDSGAVLYAREQFERLAQDQATSQPFARVARHMFGISQIVVGDDEAAIRWFNEYDDDPVCVDLRGYAQAIAGIGGLERDPVQYARSFTSETAVSYECHQLLLENFGRPSEATLRRVHALCDRARTASRWITAEFAWLKSYASYRAGHYGLAGQSFPNLEDVGPEQTALRCMILALSLELSATFDGADPLPPMEAARALSEQLSSMPIGARRSLTRRIALYLPLAGALLAFSPHSTSEIVERCAGSVIRVGTRTTVHNGAKLQPIHGGQIALTDFGLSCAYHPNQVQIQQEREAMLFTEGERLHWHRAVSPALLIFALCRIHWVLCGAAAHKETSVWERSALALHASHGLLPRSRGFEIQKRHHLEHLLLKLLRKEISPEEVKRELKQGDSFVTSSL